MDFELQTDKKKPINPTPEYQNEIKRMEKSKGFEPAKVGIADKETPNLHVRAANQLIDTYKHEEFNDILVDVLEEIRTNYIKYNTRADVNNIPDNLVDRMRTFIAPILEEKLYSSPADLYQRINDAFNEMLLRNAIKRKNEELN